MTRAVVVGGGVGGLSAAISLAQRGVEVTVCEASPFFGGLASALEVEGTRFDGGPYILLDPVGLEFAFASLGLSLESLELHAVHDVYEVERADTNPVRIFASIEHTVDQMERDHPGQGTRYRAFVSAMTRVHAALEPLQRQARPTPFALLRAGAMRHALFLLRSLRRVFHRAGLNPTIADAVGIWTHVAGQRMDDAPSPLALVPAMIHGPGCFVPARGVASIPEAVLHRARSLGITLRENARVRRVITASGRVQSVELVHGESITADLVVSNANGVSTLLELAPAPPSTRARVAALPLQSPGVAAYMLARTPAHELEGPYLRFRLEPTQADAPCRLIVRPHALHHAQRNAIEHPTRVVAPLAHAVAERLGEQGQHALLDAIVNEPWIAQRVGPAREVHRLVPASWGRRHTLYRDSMNPVMTARFMREGRLPHRVNPPDGLFLVGSSTHPGQWVSFCLISGTLGAGEALRWLDARARRGGAR